MTENNLDPEEGLEDPAVSEEEREKLIAIGRKKGLTESGAVTRAIQEYVASHENEL